MQVVGVQNSQSEGLTPLNAQKENDEKMDGDDLVDNGLGLHFNGLVVLRTT